MTRTDVRIIRRKFIKSIRGLSVLFLNPVRTVFFASIALLLFFLPGQNIYQEIIPVYHRPPVRKTLIADVSVSPYPVKTGEVSFPDISAESSVVIDVNSGVIIYGKNISERLHPASTTKIMTALVANDYYSPDDVLEVKDLINGTDESEMGLSVGDRLTVKNLLYGLLIPSGNDAAQTLAENYPGGTVKFVEAMNLKAKTLNLTGTHFSNPTGIDAPDHYTTSIDLSRMAEKLMAKPILAKIVSTNWTEVYDISGKKAYPLQNVNQLLTEFWGTVGIKTGFTDEAEECLVSAIDRGRKKYIVVVLKSKDRFTDTEKLVNWAYYNFNEVDSAYLPI